MKTITIRFEPADGAEERATYLHVDHGDGTASFLSSAALDVAPPGSPRTYREIAERLNRDIEPLGRLKPAPAPVAPTPADIERGAVVESSKT